MDDVEGSVDGNFAKRDGMGLIEAGSTGLARDIRLSRKRGGRCINYRGMYIMKQKGHQDKLTAQLWCSENGTQRCF